MPTLRIASMSIKTVVNSKSHKHEVVSISVLTHDSVNIESDTPHPESKVISFIANTILFQTSFTMLNRLLDSVVYITLTAIRK